MCVCAHIRLFAAPWTVTLQTPLSMEFSRQEYWNGLQFPTAGYLPDLWIEPASPALSSGFFITVPPGLLPESILRMLCGGFFVFVFSLPHLSHPPDRVHSGHLQVFTTNKEILKKWGLCSQIVGHLSPRALACSSCLDPVNAPAWLQGDQTSQS